MRLSDILTTAFSNLGRRKVRSFLTIFGIFVGVLTVVTMTSLGVGVQAELTRNVRAVGLETIFVRPETRDRGSDPFAPEERVTPLTPGLLDELRAMSEVASVTPMVELPPFMDLRVELNGESRPSRLFDAFGRDPFTPEAEIVAGGSLTEGAADGLLISTRLAELVGLSPAQAVGRPATLIVTLPRGEQQRFATTVVGVARRSSERIDLGLAERVAIKSWWYNRPNLLAEDGYDAAVVRARRIEDVPAVSQAIEGRNLQARSLQSILDLAARIFAVLQTMLASVGVLALFVASLGVVNTMIMAIYERTREIGVMKATGAAPGDIRRLFMAEAALMGFIGGVLGVLFGALLGKGVDRLAHWYLASQKISNVGPLSVVPPWLALGALVFAILVGLLAGLYPAARAARLDPVAALRYG